jgi:hypothetical protein
LGVNDEVETITRDTLLRWLAGDLCATAGTSPTLPPFSSDGNLSL